MSISPTLFQMFEPPKARTDAELAAHMMRMVALWPLVREDIGLQRASQVMELMRGQGLEPGSEEYAQAYQERIGPLLQRYPGIEKRGVQKAVPYRKGIPAQEFQTRFPDRYTALTSQIETAVAPLLASAPPEVRDRLMKSVLAAATAGQVPVWFRPDGSVSLDTEAAQRFVQSQIPTALQLATNLPQTTDFRAYVAEKAPALLAIAESNPLLKSHLGMPVDWREPQRAMGVFVNDLRQHADSILQGAMATVEAFKIDPSPASFSRAGDVLKGVDEMVRLGVLPGSSAQALRATLASWQAKAREVKMPDGSSQWLNLQQAQDYVNSRTQALAQQAQMLGVALAQNPANVELRKQRDGLLASAAREGIPIQPVLEAFYGRERLDIQKTRLEMAGAAQRLANARTESAQQGLQTDILRLRLGREQRVQDIWTRVGQTGSLSTLTDADRVVLALDGNKNFMGGLDMRTLLALQQQYEPAYAQAVASLPKAQNARDASGVMRQVLQFFQTDRAVNEDALTSPETSRSGATNIRNNVRLARDRLLPELVRYRRSGWIGDAEAADVLTEIRSAFAVAVNKRLLTQQDAITVARAITQAESAMNVRESPPTFWEWLRRGFSARYGAQAPRGK